MTTAQQRANKAAADTRDEVIAAKRAKSEYFITDPNMKNIGNVRLAPGQKTVILTADEAKAFIGQGLDTKSPDERAAEREKIEAADAEHREKHAEREAAREAKRASAQAQETGGEVEAPKDPEPATVAGGETPPATQAARRAR